MVTGASTAQLAVVLVDARHGVVEQTRRHAAVAALLRVPNFVLLVNKMDLVGFDKDVFAEIAAEFERHVERLGVDEVASIPISALRGDNVVEPSAEMDWYQGPTVLRHLEEVPVSADPAAEPARFPVQYVIRPQSSEFRDYRGYAGQLCSGVLRVGDEVVVLPSDRRSRIAGIDAAGVPVVEAFAPQSVTLRLADDLDVARGEMIAPVLDAPTAIRELTATVCHLAERPLYPGDHVLLRHTTRTVKAVVAELTHKLDITSLKQQVGPESLQANDIARIRLRTAGPLVPDDYAVNRQTGAFLLIDGPSGDTLTAGMIGRTR
jgi:sulfate adenylyltransferase subunit 1